VSAKSLQKAANDGVLVLTKDLSGTLSGAGKLQHLRQKCPVLLRQQVRIPFSSQVNQLLRSDVFPIATDDGVRVRPRNFIG
jgi:hypothetical protein